jgi:DNA repair protein RadC
MGGKANPKIPFTLGEVICKNCKSKISSTKKAARLVREAIGYQDQEYAVTITADHNLVVKEIRIVGIGSTREVFVTVRDIMRGAVVDGAYGIVFIHNHPSGKLKASDSDKYMIKGLKRAGKILDVELLDVIIVNKRDYNSVI